MNSVALWRLIHNIPGKSSIKAPFLGPVQTNMYFCIFKCSKSLHHHTTHIISAYCAISHLWRDSWLAKEIQKCTFGQKFVRNPIMAENEWSDILLDIYMTKICLNDWFFYSPPF